MEPEAGSTVLFDELVSNMQSDVDVGTNAITGTLNFIEGGLAQSGPLAGDGHFLALKFSTTDWDDFDKVEVGLDPSQGTGLVDVKPDPDKNGVFKITSNSQKFVVKTTAGTDVVTTEYSLADLVLSPAPVQTDFFYTEITDSSYNIVGETITGEGTETSYSAAFTVDDTAVDSLGININSLTGWSITAMKVNGSSVEVPTYSYGAYRYQFSDVNTSNDLTVEFTAEHATHGTVTITLLWSAYSGE